MNDYVPHSSGRYTFGPKLENGGVNFRLWAPAAERVELLLDGVHPMQRHSDGWYSLAMSGCDPGAHYKFLINGELECPDPASAFQPHDVLGPSEVIEHGAYQWRASRWLGRPWHEVAMLELHVGAFTLGGTFRSAIEKLDHIAATGFTAIELMPLADFAGRWNWGYDGVLLYAPDSSYGRPEDLKMLIDEAHLRGLMVFLDVVYNHFGPEGNFLPRYAPQFFCGAQTPWGDAIDYRVPQARAFAIENALYWLEQYRFDGLRLDAVHAIVEAGDPPILHELSRAAAALARRTGRHIHLMLENDNNTASLLAPLRDAETDAHYRAQWNDDYHHAWHVLLTEETAGYYKDYAAPHPHLARAFGSGFAYQGEPSVFRGGRRRGEPSGALGPAAFVNFLQNHDQIGNRPLGDRLTSLVDEHAIEAALAVTLLAPMPPLLFMGEEWGSTRPFPFFCDFTGELAGAVRRGRRAEFREAYAQLGDQVPDPLSEATFRAAKLDWDSLDTPAGRHRHALVRHLLTVRRAEIVPRLGHARFDTAHQDNGVMQASWYLGDGRTLFMLANLSPATRPRPGPLPKAQSILGEDPPPQLPAWSVFWRIGDRA